MAVTVSSDWQTTKGTVLERNVYMFEKSLMSDVQFVFQTEETRQTFPAHKYVLSTASPVFFAMFYGDLKEENKVQIADVSFRAFKEMMRFLYTDEINLDGECVLEVLYLAKKYTVPSLVAKCSEFLEKNIDEKNSLVVLEQGIKYDEADIMGNCWEVIEQRMSSIVETEEFLKITHEMLLTLLQSDDIMIDEIDLFEAVDKWAAEQCQMKSLSCSGENKREVLGEALKLVRFDCIEQKDFITKVCVKDILTYAEVINIGLSWYKEEKTISKGRRGSWMGIENSTILGNNKSYLKQLFEWLDCTPTKGLRWEMCFNANRDGFDAGTFHNRCDNKKYTLTIVQVGEYIFGGYADVPWTGGTGQYSTSSTCWIFSLKNTDNIPPFKVLSTRSPQNAICFNNFYGPTFGGGHDLYISNGANVNGSSYTNFGSSYDLPQGYTQGSSQTNAFLAGSYNFVVTNYEVFSTG